jgi:hypothetical protein
MRQQIYALFRSLFKLLPYSPATKQKIRTLINRIQGKQYVHILHIGKTGGSAVKYALQPLSINNRLVIYFHPHIVTLRDIPRGDKVVFFLREPITRFVSGFYSRQRQGKPKYFVPWSTEERIAFENFHTPNNLAADLSSNDASMALKAMENIVHVNTHYWDWFESEQYLLSRRHDILFIGFQENLEEDFECLKSILELPHNCVLPSCEIKAHRNPSNLDKSLDPCAIENLLKWYKVDYDFIDFCKREIIPKLAYRNIHLP